MQRNVMDDGRVESHMQSSTQYRDFAERCRRLMKEAKTEEQRKILQEMELAWLELADDAEPKGH
jgi:hypothetical protein